MSQSTAGNSIKWISELGSSSSNLTIHIEKDIQVIETCSPTTLAMGERWNMGRGDDFIE